MRDGGGRSRVSSTACREKWRSLVKKIKNHHHHHLLHHRHPSLTFLKDACDLFSFQNDGIQTIPKGMEPSALNLDRRLDSHDQSSISLLSQDCTLQKGRSAWSWKDDNSTDVPPWDDGGMGCQPTTVLPPAGHVIIVKQGEITRKIGIDGSPDAIKDTIRSAFRLRSKRSFWLEDEDGVVRSFDRTMPITNYTLHIDPGVTIKLYHYDECSGRQVMNCEDVTLYSEDDFQELLAHHGWQSLWEVGTYKDIESIQELRPMVSYHHSGFKDTNM